MAKYTVCISWKLSGQQEVEVEADNEEEAREAAENEFDVDAALDDTGPSHFDLDAGDPELVEGEDG